MTLYANDPDVNVVYPIKDAKGGTIDFSPIVRVAGFPDVTATWDGAARPDPEKQGGTVRDLTIPLTGLPAGALHRLRLVIPGDNDVSLGQVRLV